MKVTAIDRRAPPAAAKFSVWHSPDGWPIRRMDWPQPPGVHARGSLIFCGGRGDFIEKYLEPLGHWHQRGWSVTSFDWRSQGDSRGAIVGGHLDTFDDVLADGAALIGESLRGGGPHVAIGHSMGGHLLLRILAEHHLAPDAAVLVAPMLGINSAPLPPAVAQYVAQSATLFGLRQMPVWRRVDDKLVEGPSRHKVLTSCPERYSDELWWFEQRPGYSLGPPSWGWLAAAYRSIATLTPEKLNALKVPILIVGTETDRLVSAEAIRWTAGLLPRSELLMFKDAGHEILREVDRYRLPALERIDTFFDQNAPA